MRRRERQVCGFLHYLSRVEEDNRQNHTKGINKDAIKLFFNVNALVRRGGVGAGRRGVRKVAERLHL